MHQKLRTILLVMLYYGILCYIMLYYANKTTYARKKRPKCTVENGQEAPRKTKNKSKLNKKFRVSQ